LHTSQIVTEEILLDPHAGWASKLKGSNLTINKRSTTSRQSGADTKLLVVVFINISLQDGNRHN
jgi:hypothetical protein